MSRDLLSGTSLTPWLPPQAPVVTQSSTTATAPDPQHLSDALMLAFSNNPAWASARWVRDAYPGRDLNFDLIREWAAYCDERVPRAD